jgi:hypothetical protein
VTRRLSLAGRRRLHVEDVEPWNTLSVAALREAALTALRVVARTFPDSHAPDVALGAMGGMPVACVGDASAPSGVVLVAVQLVPGCDVFGFRLPSDDESARLDADGGLADLPPIGPLQ